jgi:hypothetical protein
MTTNVNLDGASQTVKRVSQWEYIPMNKAQKHVFRLQIRIAKAMKEGKPGKVKALQRLLTHSFYAKYLAVKQVTSNDGRHTPGIDGKIWRTKKYFTRHRLSNWRFYAEAKNGSGDKTLIYLKHASDTKIIRHVKIRGCANPYNPEFKEYFRLRKSRGKSYKLESLLGG